MNRAWKHFEWLQPVNWCKHKPISITHFCIQSTRLTVFSSLYYLTWRGNKWYCTSWKTPKDNLCKDSNPDQQTPQTENKHTLNSHPRQSAMQYVSSESWQTKFHSSAPVSVLQGVLSEAPAPRPRRLDFFLVSSPTRAGVKWGTNKQHRKWLTAAERLGTSTPWRETTSGRISFFLE